MPTVYLHESQIAPARIESLGRCRALMAVMVAVATLSLAACSKPIDKVEDVRPVRVISLVAGSGDVASEFTGDVRPRVESRLGFRVAGKIVERKIEVGSLVKKGQILMRLDPQDLGLAQAQAKAALNAAESVRDLARDDFHRYEELRQKNFVSAAILDGKQAAFRTAQASFEQALAAFKNQSNQASYTSLIADTDGVVTSIDAEVGQVVTAGAPVARVAQAGELDVVVGIPEDKINVIRQITDIRVQMWANPTQVIPATLRELSPVADPVTRTYSAKVALPANQKDVKLGMTAYVNFVAKNVRQMMRVPLTALYHEKNTTFVWVVKNGVVRLIPVTIAGASEQDVLIASGLSVGQTIVTAGVNLLKVGQKVSILGVESSSQPAKVGQEKSVAGSAK